MIVSKFGGTSVADSNAIQKVLSILKQKEEQTFVVVSAFSKITDSLVDISNNLRNRNFSIIQGKVDEIFYRHFHTAKELGVLPLVSDYLEEKKNKVNLLIDALKILGEISPRSVDLLLSFGELLSSFIIYNFLKINSLEVLYVDPREIIVTDSNFNCADVDFEQTEEKLKKLMSENGNYKFFITGGFVGSTLEGFTTTLGRGGSDYSASVIASLLGASQLEIWTDVDGIMTTDPNLVPSAKLLDVVSYKEASEMAIFGAKVLHPKTIFPAIEKNIPVYVRNTFNPNCNGTLISSKFSENNDVKAITYRKNNIVINIVSNRMLGAYGYLAKVFNVFKEFETEVDLVSTSEVSVSLTIDSRKRLGEIVKKLREIAEVDVIENCVIVSVIGEGLKNSTSIAHRIFKVLDGIKIHMVSMGASDINFSFVVNEEDYVEVVRLLHQEFFE
ncbi:MAG: lysine-sensitive aspartokinase 3 [Ignavibacteria bacterium]|nr:lysine-sensitive aspartokinase 3 [Ignavibacteria bacterium]